MKATRIFRGRVLLYIGLFFLISCERTVSEIDRQPEEKRKEIGCRVEEMNRAMWDKIPHNYKGRGTALLEKMGGNHFLRTRAVNEPYIIPVVFHVFGTDFHGKQVTRELIVDALRRTNEDFQGLAEDWNSITPPFDLLKEKLNIEFRLVEKDPDGQSTTGVNFYENRSGFGNTNQDNIISKYAWDNYSYMNVYIMLDLYGDGVTNNSGVSWYPDEWMSDHGLSRVVYNGSYLGTNTDENFRSVLTHEFGHWLNLIHTFEGGCTYPNDEVEDTPPHEKTFMTESELNCEGKKTNWQNFMNYTDNYANFTVGQVERMVKALSHPARFPLWQEENLKKVFFLGNEARIVAEEDELYEDISNDGAFSGSFRLHVKDGEIDRPTASWLDKADYRVSGLPEGLEAKVKVAEPTVLEVFFEGKSLRHAASDNTIFDLSFVKTLIKDKELYTAAIPLKLLFRDPFRIVYTDCPDVIVNAANNWTLLQLSSNYSDSRYGFWFDAANGNKLRIETYQKALLCRQFSRNISFIQGGEMISAASSFWIKGGATPYQQDLCSASYRDWVGKTGYVGFYFQGASPAERLYGWMRIGVNEDGTSFTLYDYAYNECPNEGIIAGKKDSDRPYFEISIVPDRAEIKAGETVQFSAKVVSENPIAAYRWSLPGGKPGNADVQNPVITYEKPGIYDVTLEVTDERGNAEVFIAERLIQVKGGNQPGTEEGKADISRVVILTGEGEHFLEVKNLSDYTEPEMAFYNPRGKLLFHRKDYANDYKLDGLSAGTYYYVFSYAAEGGRKSEKGYVEIIRKK